MVWLSLDRNVSFVLDKQGRDLKYMKLVSVSAVQGSTATAQDFLDGAKAENLS